MFDIEKVEETSTSENQEELKNTEEESEKDESEENKKEEEFDYQAKLEEERKLRLKAESSAQYHREEAERLRKEREENPEIPEDEPLTRKDLAQLEASITRKTFRTQVESEVTKLAKNPHEAELILFHYDNSIVPTGNITKDVSRARLLANEARILRDNEELSLALESRANRKQNVGSGGQRPSDRMREPILDQETKKHVDRNKMKWDSKSGLYRNERGVTFDPKTGSVTEAKK